MAEKANTFLIVEDNELDVEKITRSMKRLKIDNDTIRAKNGQEALDVLQGTNGKEKLLMPYIILLDLNMPKMNGLEFLEELRADHSIAHSPVFILTTSDSPKDIEAAHKFNVCGYIVKPIKMEQMFEALSTLNMYWNLIELPLGQEKS